jgi:hypothetical protein
VRRGARVALLRRGVGGHQLDVDTEHLHGLLASHIAGIGPQEASSADQPFMSASKSRGIDIPLAARAARSLPRVSNIVL